ALAMRYRVTQADASAAQRSVAAHAGCNDPRPGSWGEAAASALNEISRILARRPSSVACRQTKKRPSASPTGAASGLRRGTRESGKADGRNRPGNFTPRALRPARRRPLAARGLRRPAQPRERKTGGTGGYRAGLRARSEPPPDRARTARKARSEDRSD